MDASTIEGLEYALLVTHVQWIAKSINIINRNITVIVFKWDPIAVSSFCCLRFTSFSAGAVSCCCCESNQTHSFIRIVHLSYPSSYVPLTRTLVLVPYLSSFSSSSSSSSSILTLGSPHKRATILSHGIVR